MDKVFSKIPTPSPEKLLAWAAIRVYWTKNKLKHAEPELLDLEWEASQVD